MRFEQRDDVSAGEVVYTLWLSKEEIGRVRLTDLDWLVLRAEKCGIADHLQDLELIVRRIEPDARMTPEMGAGLRIQGGSA